jgi:hypothetical protein
MAAIKTGSPGDGDVPGDIDDSLDISPSADTTPGHVVHLADMAPEADVGPLGSLTPELFDNIVRRVSTLFLQFATFTHSRGQATLADYHIASSTFSVPVGENEQTIPPQPRALPLAEPFRALKGHGTFQVHP